MHYFIWVPAHAQLQKEAREKEETSQRMLMAEKRVRVLEDDNRQLRREASEMKKELDKLRKEVRNVNGCRIQGCEQKGSMASVKWPASHTHNCKCRAHAALMGVSAICASHYSFQIHKVVTDVHVYVQKLQNSSSKSPRSPTQCVASPNRKRQCSGASHDELDNSTIDEQDEETEPFLGAGKRGDSSRVDVQAVAAGL